MKVRIRQRPVEEGVFDIFKRGKSTSEPDWYHAGPVDPEMPRGARSNPDIIKHALKILEKEPEGMTYADLTSALEKSTNPRIHEDIPETLESIPDFFRDEAGIYKIPDEMRKRHKRWRSGDVQMENLFESFRRWNKDI